MRVNKIISENLDKLQNAQLNESYYFLYEKDSPWHDLEMLREGKFTIDQLNLMNPKSVQLLQHLAQRRGTTGAMLAPQDVIAHLASATQDADIQRAIQKYGFTMSDVSNAIRDVATSAIGNLFRKLWPQATKTGESPLDTATRIENQTNEPASVPAQQTVQKQQSEPLQSEDEFEKLYGGYGMTRSSAAPSLFELEAEELPDSALSPIEDPDFKTGEDEDVLELSPEDEIQPEPAMNIGLEDEKTRETQLPSSRMQRVAAQDVAGKAGAHGAAGTDWTQDPVLASTTSHLDPTAATGATGGLSLDDLTGQWDLPEDPEEKQRKQKEIQEPEQLAGDIAQKLGKKNPLKEMYAVLGIRTAWRI